MTDPTLKTYNVLNFKRGVGSLIGLRSFKEGIRSLGTGYMLKGIQGDSLQQGGAVVIGPGGILHYLYGSKEAGDNPPIQDMLDAVN